MINEIYENDNLVFKKESKISKIDEYNLEYFHILDHLSRTLSSFVGISEPRRTDTPLFYRVITENGLDILLRSQSISDAKMSTEFIFDYILILEKETLKIIYEKEIDLSEVVESDAFDGIFKEVPAYVLSSLQSKSSKYGFSYSLSQYVEHREIEFLNSCLPKLFLDSCEEIVRSDFHDGITGPLCVKAPGSNLYFPIESMGSGFKNVFNFLRWVFYWKDDKENQLIYPGLFRSLHPLIVPYYEKFIKENVKGNIITTTA